MPRPASSSSGAARASRSPTSSATGASAGSTLKTDARALVPRPETEIVVERCLALLEGIEAPRVVDVGTGSGAIALAAEARAPRRARHRDGHLGRSALALARENAERNRLSVELGETDLLAGLAGPFDLVVSNPPYVLARELAGLEPEVRDWEPRAALVDAGQTERPRRRRSRVLDGWLVLEVHERPAGETVERLSLLGYAAATISLDLGGRERVVEARWEPATMSRER